MNLITQICFWICIVCLFGGVLASILAVWGAITGDAIWRAITTFVILFIAAGAFQGICSYFHILQ